MATLTYDQITAITRKHWMPKFPQWVFDQNFLQKRLAAKGTKPDSGTQIIQPGIYQVSKGGAYSPYDTFDQSAEDQITAAVFNWKYYQVPITISRDELLKNTGKEGVRKLLDAKMKAAAMKMSDLLATDTLATSAGTYGTDSSEILNCLDNAINNGADDLGTGFTYGGITKAASTYTWWFGTAYDGGGTGYGPTSVGIQTMWFRIADGDIQPTLILSHNNTLSTYVGIQQGLQRYMKESTMAAGFLAYEFNGRPWAADLHVADDGTTTEATNRMYFLNENFLDFVVHRDENNRLEPFAKPIDQAVITARIMFAGELTCSDPSRQGCIYNFDSVDGTNNADFTLA